MPRYYFHLKDGSEHLDAEGVELASADQVRAAAVVAAGEALKDLGETFWKSTEWRMWVTDEAGTTVCALNVFAE